MPAYRHLFFDLDHTLWDFDRCSGETLEELFHEHRMDALGVACADAFVSTFRTINRDLWNQYGAGQITQQQLRDTRFALVFNQLGLPETDIHSALTEQYMQRCSRKPHLRPYAREVLDHLRDKYVLHILTNGFDDVQFIKMQSSGITDYFTHIITAEKAGCYKPNARIFDYALQRAGARLHHSLMIGDSLEADVVGARNAGMDHVFYNCDGLSHSETPTYEIACLSELLKIL
jgi:putative hydrolase of the HAD superfamily